jgi:hypothetical protein
MAMVEIYNRPKFRRLVRTLGINRAHVLGHLESLWMCTYQAKSPILDSADDVEMLAEWEGEPGAFVAAAVTEGWLDDLGDGRLAVHNWFKRAPDYVPTDVARRMNCSWAEFRVLTTEDFEKLTPRVKEKAHGNKTSGDNVTTKSPPSSDNVTTQSPPCGVVREGKVREGKGREGIAEDPDRACARVSDSAFSTSEGDSAPDPGPAPPDAPSITTDAPPGPPAGQPAQTEADRRAAWAELARKGEPTTQAAHVPTTAPSPATLDGIAKAVSVIPAPSEGTGEGSAQDNALRELWKRINRITRDKRAYMDWWTSVLPRIVAVESVHGALLEALDYAADCADEVTRARKGIGEPLKKPGAYVSKKVFEAARAANLQLPDQPRKRDAA